MEYLILIGRVQIFLYNYSKLYNWPLSQANDFTSLRRVANGENYYTFWEKEALWFCLRREDEYRLLPNSHGWFCSFEYRRTDTMMIPGLKPSSGESQTWWVGILTAEWRKSCFQSTLFFVFRFTSTDMHKHLSCTHLETINSKGHPVWETSRISPGFINKNCSN